MRRGSTGRPLACLDLPVRGWKSGYVAPARAAADRSTSRDHVLQSLRLAHALRCCCRARYSKRRVAAPKRVGRPRDAETAAVTYNVLGASVVTATANQFEWLQVRLGRIRLSSACPFRLFHTFLSLRPTRRYPRLWIRRPSSGRRRDFNPPDQCAAQRTLRRAPTPRHPSRRASLPSLDGTAAIQRPEMTRSPKFLGDPHACVPRFFDPGGTSGAGPPGLAVPTHRSSGVAFRGYCLVGFHNLDISEPNSAAHTLAVYASPV
jgi:hypothetical protein